MPVQATVFSQLLQHIPWGVFDRAVAAHRADKGCRRFNARSHLAALLAGQLFEAHGLRDIEAVTTLHATALGRRGLAPARRSTLADANATRTPLVFEAIVPTLLSRLTPAKLAQTGKALRLVDATLVRPDARAAEWARFERRSVAAKLHVVYDPALEAPVFFELTGGNVNDITVAKTAMPLTPGATYVFDLGFYDFGFWADLDAAGCRLVTRLKRNTRVTVKGERPLPTRRGSTDQPGTILADRIVTLPPRQAGRRANPFAKDGRVVVVATQSGKPMTLFTNDLTSHPQQIADLYKKRWDIELFFRWIKQNLRITRFHGVSENAVRLQIVAAIILYILMKIIHQTSCSTQPMRSVIALVRNAMFHRLNLFALTKAVTPPQRPPSPTQPQLRLAL